MYRVSVFRFPSCDTEYITQLLRTACSSSVKEKKNPVPLRTIEDKVVEGFTLHGRALKKKQARHLGLGAKSTLRKAYLGLVQDSLD